MNGQITNLTNTIEANETTINSLNGQIISLNTQIAGLNQTITTNEKTISDLRININELNTEIERLTQNNSANETEIRLLNNEISSLNEQIISLDNQNKNLLATISSLETEVSELTAEKNTLIIENTNYYNTISSLNNQIVNLQNVNTQLENTNTLHLNTIASLNTQIANLNQQISEITYESQNNNLTISSLNTKIKELEESVQYYENYIANLENENQVVATFEYDGSVYNIQIVNKGSLLAVATPANTAYVIFNGWTVDGEMIDLSTYIISKNTKIVADLTYKYDVVFKVDNVNYDTQIVTKNESPNLPANPTKTGYIFDGWSIDGVTLIDNLDTVQITNNTTYYAVFTKVYTVNFVYENITKSTQSVRNGKSATIVNIENTPYKIFNGWKVNGSIVDVSTYKITSDTTFVADITYRYDVVYKVDNKNFNSQIVTANNYPTLPNNPVKEGYVFEGWSLNGIDVINTSTIQITSNTTYYAVFTKLYNVTFVYEGNTISTQTIKENETAKAVNVNNTAYKVFNGWKVNNEFVNIANYTITQDTTFVADITYKYDVLFMVDDAIHNSQIVIKNGFATLPNNPTKTGYAFDGWTINGTDVINPETKSIVQNTTYIAKFTKTYIATFIYEDVIYNTQEVRVNGFASNVVVENTDYKIFNGWKVNEIIVDETTYIITQDTTFIADITYKYDVVFMVDDESYNSQLVVANNYPTLPANPTKDGYHFIGWSINGTDVVNPSSISINNNTTFIAIFEQPFVKFVVDGSTFESKYVAINSYATTSKTPTKSGYVFDGWTIDGSNIVNLSTYKITTDTTFTAKFSKIHTVTFKYEDSVYSTQQVVNNNKPTNVSVSSTDYKVFNGWMLNGSIVDVATCKITSDTTFIASITYRHKVDFVANNNIIGSYFVNHNGYLDFDTLYNLHIDLDQYDSNNGKFIGWSTNSNVHNTAIYEANYVDPNSLQEYAVTNDISFYAVYEYEVETDYTYKFEAEVLNTSTNTTYTISFDIQYSTMYGTFKPNNKSDYVSKAGTLYTMGNISEVFNDFDDKSILPDEDYYTIYVKVSSKVFSSTYNTIAFCFDREQLYPSWYIYNPEATAEVMEGYNISIISATITRVS